ncbi:retinol dehydrogenase 11-like isoform X2 [Ostrea edulis]|uniref:retinol dehydrogenase 11-like isoform X2 n=1 Tax=Ostrea edulis TaxID=37623 RepID=UPI0024AE8D21|nr:retinol dehydrogenase 11-like isoform X2 [Ostrea edulis]
MTGRVIIITGANSGIGFEAARKLCEAGNDVILACRSEENGKAAVERILEGNPNALATFLQLDVADLASVRKFVEDFHNLGKKLHVLVNNAGLFLRQDDRVRQFTKDNFELTMGTNYLGPFLLTHLLLDDLKKTGSESGDSRIVMVTSSLHDLNNRMNRDLDKLDMENFFMEKEGSFSGNQAYKNSKVALVMFMYSLARKLEGTGVAVNSMCPGFIPDTQLSRHASSAKRFMLKYLISPLLRVAKVTRTTDHGSKMIVELSVNEKYKDVSGKYLVDFEAQESSEESQNEEMQKQLYELSARYCHLEGYEPLDAPAPPPPQEKPAKWKKDKTPRKEKNVEEKVKEEKETEGEGPDMAEGIMYADEDEKTEEKEDDESEKKPVQVTITVEDVTPDSPQSGEEELIKPSANEGKETNAPADEENVAKLTESGEITAEVTAQ